MDDKLKFDFNFVKRALGFPGSGAEARKVPTATPESEDFENLLRDRRLEPRWTPREPMQEEEL